MATNFHDLVLDAIPSGVVVVDADSIVKRCNPAVRSYLAMVPEPEGVHVERAIPCPPLHRVIAHAFGGGEVVERVEGVGRFDLLLRAVPLDSGEGVVVVIYDVTEMSGVERARSDFVAAVSHELRTPVTSILGFSETMLDHVDLDETSVYMVEAIKRNAERLSTLFQELLHLYRIEARESDLPLEGSRSTRWFELSLTIIRWRQTKETSRYLFRSQILCGGWPTSMLSLISLVI